MKRASFLLTCLWVLCKLCTAQDIYTAGFCLDAYGLKSAAVFKNDAVVYQRSEVERDLYASAIVIDTVNDAVYWSCNTNPVNSISEGYGRVMKNDAVFLDNVLGTQVNAIALNGDDLYSAGFVNDVFESVAAVWKNGETTPLYMYNRGKRSEVLDLVVVDGVVYACGYYVDVIPYGCVWVDGELYACYPHNTVRSIDYCNGGLYYALGELTSFIYKSGQELYELYNNNGTANLVSDITVEDGDVYSVGFMGFNDCFVWKNADFLYVHPYAREANLNACYCFGSSLYYVGWDHENHGIIFKDGEQLYSLEGCNLYDVFVKSDPLAVEAEHHGKLAVYPNPTRESIVVDGIDEGEGVHVYDMEGRLVRSAKAGPDRKIDVRSLPAGLYWVRCGKEGVPFVKE
ncbi:MAG: T9SS type A sorting domain-containing protein [Bacteroidales bacterium]|nr:T9SS type A sorting domain-containing protein [Bacteroidales bacterium]